MSNILKVLAILVGKAIILASRLAGHQGSNLPGKAAARIYPPLLQVLSRNIIRSTMVITGTNGKTTTANMVAAIIRAQGNTFVHNQAGANMIPGITTAFINSSNWLGNRQLDYALLETDEANVPLLLQVMKPRYLLITNFFRDQLDRFGELDYTIGLIKDAVKGTGIELVLNGDDPLQSDFAAATGLHCWYYGFADTNYDSLAGADSREGRFCVICGQELEYVRFHYAQLGVFKCPGCGNTNPNPDFQAHWLRLTPNISFEVNNLAVESPYQGFYNAYNLLAAVALARLTGMDTEVIQKALAEFRPQAGRMETFAIKGKKIILILIKNPTGFNQSLNMLGMDPAPKNLFLALNDNVADGRDVSWIWDADVEILAQEMDTINRVICSGQRSGDMAVRVKYAGIPADKICIQSDLEDGITAAVDEESVLSYIFCTYTALFASRKILDKLQQQYYAPQAGGTSLPRRST